MIASTAFFAFTSGCSKVFLILVFYLETLKIVEKSLWQSGVAAHECRGPAHFTNASHKSCSIFSTDGI